MDRIPRSLWAYEDVGRVHLSLSGTLLETLASHGFQCRPCGIVDCGSLLWYLQNTKIIHILGTGYYIPCCPSSPEPTVTSSSSAGRGSASTFRPQQRADSPHRRRMACEAAEKHHHASAVVVEHRRCVVLKCRRGEPMLLRQRHLRLLVAAGLGWAAAITLASTLPPSAGPSIPALAHRRHPRRRDPRWSRHPRRRGNDRHPAAPADQRAWPA